jgi:hypothetical protein
MGRSPEADFHHNQNLIARVRVCFHRHAVRLSYLVRLQARCVARLIAKTAAKAVSS